MDGRQRIKHSDHRANFLNDVIELANGISDLGPTHNNGLVRGT